MNWQLILSACSLGLLSSFHCVGMCGAIAFSLPTQHLERAAKLTGILLYNAGRIFTYTLLGLLFGVIGRTIYLGGFQQWFSIGAGLVILLVLFSGSLGLPVFRFPGFNKMNLFIRQWIGHLLHHPGVGSTFFLGMANGLLPCGLVYLAVTGALAEGSISGAAAFMIAFGMGTFPAMFILSYFGYLINISTRNALKKAVPYVIALMAVLLIVRGMGLGIPYVSPVLAGHPNNAILCH